MYLLPMMEFSSIAFAIPSPANALGPLCVELHLIPRSSRSFLTSLACAGVQVK